MGTGKPWPDQDEAGEAGISVHFQPVTDAEPSPHLVDLGRCT